MRSHILVQGLLSQGGILASERCIEAHISEAMRLGAEVHTGVKVLSWQASGSKGDVSIITDAGTFVAKKAIFAAGSWMPRLVPELQVSFFFLISSHIDITKPCFLSYDENCTFQLCGRCSSDCCKFQAPQHVSFIALAIFVHVNGIPA